MAKVTKDFLGVADGQVTPTQFVVGDEVTGDLAVSAIAGGLAKPDMDEKRAMPVDDKKSNGAAPENK